MARYDQMIKYKKDESEIKKKKVIHTLQKMVEEKENINIVKLAERAKVSRAFIYKHNDIKKEVYKLRSKDYKQTDTSKENIIKLLNKKMKRLEHEYNYYKNNYEKLEVKVKKLEEENTALHQQLYNQI